MTYLNRERLFVQIKDASTQNVDAVESRIEIFDEKSYCIKEFYSLKT